MICRYNYKLKKLFAKNIFILLLKILAIFLFNASVLKVRKFVLGLRIIVEKL